MDDNFDIAKYAADVAKYLGWYWQPFVDSHADNQYAILEYVPVEGEVLSDQDLAGAKLWFGHVRNGKTEVSGLVPSWADHAMRVVMGDHVTIAVTRKPASAAESIQARVLATYLPAYKMAMRQELARRDFYARSAGTAARYRTLLPGAEARFQRDLEYAQRGGRTLSYDASLLSTIKVSGPNLSVDMHVSNDTLYIEGHSNHMPLEVGERFLTMLALYITEVPLGS